MDAIEGFAEIDESEPCGYIVSLDEWVLAQPIKAKTLAGLSCLMSAALFFCLFATLIVAVTVCAMIGLGKVVDLSSVLVLIIVLALNSFIGLFVKATRFGKEQDLALVRQIWFIWTTLIFALNTSNYSNHLSRFSHLWKFSCGRMDSQDCSMG